MASLVILSITTSCTRNEPQLLIVEQIIDQKPDSALLLLESIDFPDELTERDYAKYCQLLVTAHQKNKIMIHNDTLIQFAVRHYKKNASDMNNYIRSLILAGNVYEERDSDYLAEKYYKEAFELSKNIHDSLSMGISSFELGGLYKYMANYDESISWFRIAFEVFKTKGNTVMKHRSLRHIADCYALSGKTETALDIYNQLLAILPDTKNNVKADFYKNMAMTYKDTKHYQEGLANIRKSIELTSKESLYPIQYTILASLYSATGQRDSAAYYNKEALQYAISQGDLSLILKVYEIQLEKEYNKTFENYILSGSVSDSIYQKQKYETVKYQRLYNVEKIKERNKDLIIQRQYIIFTSVLLISIMIALFLYIRIQKRKKEVLLIKEIDDKNDIINSIRNNLFQELNIYNKMVRLSISANKEKYKTFLKEYNKILYNKDEDFEFEWNTLVYLVNNIFDNYAQKLNNICPDISEIEEKIIILQKAGYNVSEISDILGKSIHTIYKYNSAIRKKMNMTDNETIVDFFEKII